MSLISDIFQQNQYFTQNPTTAVRTPRQQAYDELLNKQYDIQQENQNYNTYNNLASGMGGLGKILASAFVKNPIEKAAAANGITEQETRTDGLRQAYEQARQAQNKDYVQQAKDQLAMAIADEDKALADDWKTKEFDYRKAYDDAKQSLAEKIANAEIDYKNAQRNALNNKPAELTAEEKIKEAVAMEEAKENAKNKRAAQQSLKEAKAGQKAFEDNIKYLEDLSKQSGNVLDRSLGGIAGIFTGKNTGITAPNNAMGELVAQIKQAALTASGISGEGDDKAQQAKLKDIYRRAGVDENAKSLTQAQASSIINNIKNIYKQRVAEKQNLLDSFNDNNFSATWRQ